jgi:hypothetical protein
MISAWIDERNLAPFLKALGWFVGYDFGTDDWNAIRSGMEQTDHEAGRWYDYTFFNDRNGVLAHCSIALDPGTCVVHMKVRVSAGVVPKVHGLVEVCQHFYLQEVT